MMSWVDFSLLDRSISTIPILMPFNEGKPDTAILNLIKMDSIGRHIKEWDEDFVLIYAK